MITLKVFSAFYDRILVPHFPAIESALRRDLLAESDPVRTCTLAMALETVKREQLLGDMAEVGVFRGDMALLMNRVLPDKTLFSV